MVNELVERLREQNMELEVTDAVKEKVSEEGYDPQYGARPLRRALQKLVEDRLSEEVLKGTVREGQHIIVDVENGEIVIKPKEKTILS